MLIFGLCRDAGPGIRGVHATNGDQPVQPHIRVGVHHHHQREQRSHLGFDQKRDVLDDHLIVGDRGDDLGTPRRDQRMHDRVEPGALLLIGERFGRQSRTVQRTVGQQDVVAEMIDQRRQALGAGLHHLAGDDIAVDDHSAALGEGR